MTVSSVPPQLHKLAWSRCLELLWSESRSVPNTVSGDDKPTLKPRIINSAKSVEIVKDLLDAYEM